MTLSGSGRVDFHGEELEPFQLALLETLGVEPVNYEPIGDCRSAVQRAVAAALEKTERDDELTAAARRWLTEGCAAVGEAA
jgi:hypothetical protein